MAVVWHETEFIMPFIWLEVRGVYMFSKVGCYIVAKGSVLVHA
jgi:hypothetical protein